MRIPGRRCVLLAIAVTLPACGKIKGLLGMSDGNDKPPPAKEAPKEPTPTVAPIEDAAPPEPLVRADRKLRFPLKSSEQMGFDLSKLSELYALAGAVEVPEWSRPGDGAARLVRDDDGYTTWSCTPADTESCALGIHFPRDAGAEMIRVQFSSPTENEAHARPRRVRVHTAQGFAETTLPEKDGPWHLGLGEPITTRNVILEILDTYGEGTVPVAEFEVFGRTGTARPPLEIEPDRRVVSILPPVWRRRSRTHTAGTAFIEQVDVDGKLTRLVPGTALLGRAGDRLMLIERMEWTLCNDNQTVYDLLDRKTRVIVPLGDMGGFGGDIHRHSQGLGFAMAHIDGLEGSVQAVVIDDDRFEHRTSNRLERRTPQQLLKDWGFEPEPMDRADAGTLADPPAGCGAARIDQLDALRPMLPKRTKLVASQWHTCSLGGGTQLLMTTQGDCGREWRIAVLDGENSLIREHSAKESGAHIRLRRLDGEAMLVELWGSKDRPTVRLVDIDGVRAIEGTTTLSLRPPADCRKHCGARFEDLRAKTD